MKSTIAVLFLLLPMIAVAADGEVVTRSTGKYLASEAAPLQQRLQQSDIEQLAELPKKRLLHGASEGSSMTLSARRYSEHGLPVEFTIFDAWAELSGDVDADGYFHRISVVVDADVNAALESVYVDLYLSRDGGDWVRYTSSDLFEITFDDATDTYEVVTELIEGYPPGYYDVLIELHSPDHGGVVASRVLLEDELGAVLSLEDMSFDEPYIETVTTVETRTVHAGGGSVSLAGLLMYGLLLLIKFRCFRSGNGSRRCAGFRT